MSFDRLYRYTEEEELAPATRAGGFPGKVATTSRLLVLRMARDTNGVGDGAETAINRAASSSGQALPSDVKSRFESSLGADLSSVRVHTGAESAEAAKAVGAKAYTTGQDIHFGAGYYDPTSAFGTHLLAHEVAHTVQQQGGAPSRQHKLEVSAPQDAAEVEADRAADAMVSGASFSVGGASTMIARADAPAGDKPAEEAPDGEAADKAWAQEARTKIQAVQTAALAAQTRLNADAEKGLTALKSSQASFDEFDRRFDGALANFTKQVTKALAQMADLRKKRDVILSTAMGAAGGPFKVIEGVTGVLGKIEKIALVLDIKGPAAGKGMPTGAHSDWKALVGTAIDSFSGYLRQNGSLTAINEKCTASEKFLDTVVEGKAPEGARSSGDGQQADKIAEASASAAGELGSVEAGTCSTAAQTFATDAKTRLETVTATKMEQDLAIQWLGGLTKEEFEQIDDCADYLRGLGVFDGAASRLGVDTGLMVNDDDEELIALRARIESEAMAQVGAVVPWTGMTMDLGAGGVAGQVSAGGRTWEATGPRTLAHYAGSVQIASYHIDSMGPESTTDRVSNPEREAILYASVTFAVQPTGGVGQCPVERDAPDAAADESSTSEDESPSE